MSPNRVVAVLTPLVFAPLAGAIATWIANNVPGAEISRSSLEEVFIGGALIALAPAAQWLHGWQKYEARQATLAKDSSVPEPAPEPEAFEAAEPDEIDELDELAELDELEAELLAEDEEPAGVGS
jgi:hypothetical protein